MLQSAARDLRCYKKIDPFADTETRSCASVAPVDRGYKKIDPFADTETYKRNSPRHLRTSYKKIDPFADTETRRGCVRRRCRRWLQKNRSVCGY